MQLSPSRSTTVALALCTLGLLACSSGTQGSPNQRDSSAGGADSRSTGDGARADTHGDFRPASGDAGSPAGASDGGAANRDARPQQGDTAPTPHSDGTTASETAPPSPRGKLAVVEGFNQLAVGSAPPDWQLDTSGGTARVEAFPFPADHSLKLAKQGTAAAASASRSFPALRGRVVVEAKVMADETTGYKCAPYLYSAEGANLAAVAFQDGQIKAFKGPNLSSMRAFSAGTWYIVRLVVNLEAETYSVYIDGELMLAQATFRAQGKNLARVWFNIGEGNQGTLHVDNLKVYSHQELIGAPPEPVFDVRSFGAKGDGTTKDTQAIQAAIDACAGSGGSVVLKEGVFVSGMITLKSKMTLFIDASATLLGSRDKADFPTTHPPTGNTQLRNCRKALIYAEGAEDITIDGGGIIDGNGKLGMWLGGHSEIDESLRPMAIYNAQCKNVTLQNLYIKDAAMWGVVSLETDDLTIRNLVIHSDVFGNRDGIDVLDCHRVRIEDCTIYSEDDAICLKSGVRRGLRDVVVRNCYVTQSTVANGLKFGTASYGGFHNVLFEDVLVKNVDKAAMAVESVDGAEISNITFRRIDVQNAGTPFFILLGDRGGTPADDVHKIGSIEGIRFETIKANRMRHSWGSPISGALINGQLHKLTKLHFEDIDISFKGGLGFTPADPPEYVGQYPDPNLWGDLPAYGYYLRHVEGVTFRRTRGRTQEADARQERVVRDVTGLVVE